MTRVGWTFLTLVLLAMAALLATTQFGGPAPAPVPAVQTETRSTVVDRVERLFRRPPVQPDDGSMTAGLPTLIVPVLGVARSSIADTWGQARSEGRVHHGTDIPAPAGTPVLAAADGTIEKLYPSRLGGTTLYERSADGRWTFYYAHLSAYAPGLHEGQVVHTGDPIAYVGDTGDAGIGNFHLHFGLTRTTPDQHWYQGEDVDAFPALAGTATRR